MIRFFVSWLMMGGALIFVSQQLSGVEVSNYKTALFAVFIIGCVNTFIKPLVKLFTLPINLLTLGLFTLVINAAMFSLAALFVAGFSVKGFWAAILGSVLFSICSMLINFLTKIFFK